MPQIQPYPLKRISQISGAVGKRISQISGAVGNRMSAVAGFGSLVVLTDLFR
jgi:hypothetical protein